MEHQIRYYWSAMGPGTLSANEQTLRLRGYTAARQRASMWVISWVVWIIWVIVWQEIENPVRVYLGLPAHGELWADFVAVGLSLVPLIVGVLPVWLWPTSITPDEFEKKYITGIGRGGKRISFDLPNPFKPGKFMNVNLKAKSIEEAEQIVEALLKGQKIASTMIIPPDVEKDILLGQLSKRDIMTKYAIRAEELEEMYSLLAGKPQEASQRENH